MVYLVIKGFSIKVSHFIWKSGDNAYANHKIKHRHNFVERDFQPVCIVSS